MATGGMMMAFCLIVIALRVPWPIEFMNFILLGFGFYMLHGCMHVYATELAPTARGSATGAHAFFFFEASDGADGLRPRLPTVGVVPVLLFGAAIAMHRVGLRVRPA